MQDIKTILDKENPHIFGISVANLQDFEDRQIVSLPDHNLHVSHMIKYPKIKIE